MKAFAYTVLVAISLAAAMQAQAGSFARSTPEYCRDLALTAQHAAKSRIEGKPYSSTLAINGYRPTRERPENDQAHDRKSVAEQIYNSDLSPDDSYLVVILLCKD